MSFQYFNIFCELLILLLGTCINVRNNRRLKYCLLQIQYSHSYVQNSLAPLDIEVDEGLKAQDLLTLLVVKDPCYKCVLLKLLYGVVGTRWVAITFAVCETSLSDCSIMPVCSFNYLSLWEFYQQ